MDWSRDFPADAQLALLVHLERAPGQADEAVVLRDAIHEFFGDAPPARDAGCASCSSAAESVSPSASHVWLCRSG